MSRHVRGSFLVAIAVASILTGRAAATLVLYEPFADATANGGTSYATGAAVTGANSPATASGQNNGPMAFPNGGAKWYAAGPISGTTTNNTVAATNLSVPGLIPSASGGSMEFGVSDGPSSRVNLNAVYTTGTMYYSFALKVANLGSLGTSGGFVVAFNNAQNAQTGTPTVVTDCLMIRSAAGGTFNLGVRKGSGTPTWGATNFAVNDSIFLVGSYTFNPSTADDVAKLWLNPSSSTFGGATPADDLVHNQAGQADIAQIASLVFFRRGNANTTLQPSDMFADEIRVGTTWADVTPVTIPEAGALALCGFTGMIGAAVVGVRRFWKNRALSRLAV